MCWNSVLHDRKWDGGRRERQDYGSTGYQERIGLRFLLDGMLGKLSRWLRMLGYETIYQNDSSDNELLVAAKRDSLILLTSDEELYRTASIRGLESFLIQGCTEPERLANLAKRYNLTLKINPKDSRCPACGSWIGSGRAFARSQRDVAQHRYRRRNDEVCADRKWACCRDGRDCNRRQASG